MRSITVRRIMDAPIESVFGIVSDIREFSKVAPHMVKYEFLSDVRSGVGTRFRETRLLHGKEVITELEVTEYVENERVRMVADDHGAVWDTVFAVRAVDGRVELRMTMESKPYKLAAKIGSAVFRGKIQKAVEKDMDAVQAHCER